MSDNGPALLVLAFLGGLAFLTHGWPKLFTINIHKHYDKEEK